jgi:hypothetical protein
MHQNGKFSSSYEELKIAIKNSLPEQTSINPTYKRGNCLKRAQAKKAVECILFAIIVMHLEDHPDQQKDLAKLDIIQKIFLVQYNSGFVFNCRAPLALELSSEIWNELQQFFPDIDKAKSSDYSTTMPFSQHSYNLNLSLDKLTNYQSLAVARNSVDMDQVLAVFKEIILEKYNIIKEMCRPDTQSNGTLFQQQSPIYSEPITPRPHYNDNEANNDPYNIFQQHIKQKNNETELSENPFQLSLADFGLSILEPQQRLNNFGTEIENEQPDKVGCFSCNLL